MATPLELISDKTPLREDKSRLSIEGALAGASLAVVLTVLWPALGEASEWVGDLLEGPGPIESKPPEDGGNIKLNSGDLNISPLDRTGNEEPDEVILDNGSKRSNLEMPQNNTPKSLDNNSRIASTPVNTPIGEAGGQVPRGSGEKAEAPEEEPYAPEEEIGLPEENPYQPQKGLELAEEKPYPNVGLTLVEDQRYIRVSVNSPVESIGRSVDERATGNVLQVIKGISGVDITIQPPSNGRQILSYIPGGVLKDTINISSITQRLLESGNLSTELKDTGADPSLGINTTGVSSAGAKSTHADGLITLKSENHGALASTITSFRNAAEYIQIKALDAIKLLGQVGREFIGQSESITTGGKNLGIRTGKGDDSVLIAGNTSVDGYVSAGDLGMNLDIGVNTIGIDGSSIMTSAGDDQIVIAATMKNQENIEKTGVSLELDKTMTTPTGNIDFDLAATGMNNSYINTGAGNDRIIIQAAIDEYLVGQVAAFTAEDISSLKLNVGKSIVSMQDSVLLAGDGNDTIILRGDVNNSIISTGTGKDLLVIQGRVGDDNSLILEEQDVYINVPLEGRTETLGINKQNWNTRDTSEVTLVLGDESNNTIESTGSFKENVLILGKDLGKLYETAFLSIENFRLDGGNDNVTFERYGQLTGLLDGGSGYDSVSFESSNLRFSNLEGQPDIDGVSNPIGAGNLDNFEHIVGSNNGDIIMLSNQSDGTQEGIRHIQLGLGEDIVVFDDIESLRMAWDGIGGIPIVENLDLTGNDQIAYRVGGSDERWWIQKNIMALPDDLIRNGTITTGFGLSVGITENSNNSGTLYHSGALTGNIELASLRNVRLPDYGTQIG